MSRAGWLALRLLSLIASGGAALAQPFYLPTPNRALLQADGEGRFFAGTVGKPWTSGTFGCVRTDGQQFHEGWDILTVQRDSRGEPTDPVTATAAGVVVYLNAKPGLSNFGRYVILRHRLQGLELYSTYAHLSAIAPNLAVGDAVQAGERIGTLGRSTNTRQSIAKERAHLHFELNLRISDRFTAWQQQNEPGQRNDHGEFNGRNFLGLDPFRVFHEQLRLRTNFSLTRLLAQQTELCRVVVRAIDFPWLRRYPQLVEPNPRARREGVAGYELALNYHGLPFRLIPRAASEIPGPAQFQLLSVNEAEQRARPCGKLVLRRSGRWQLTASGERLLRLLTF
jgi:murein DD-endopeptidase MepM/ murein hydrolase activator NlpD